MCNKFKERFFSKHEICQLNISTVMGGVAHPRSLRFKALRCTETVATVMSRRITYQQARDLLVTSLENIKKWSSKLVGKRTKWPYFICWISKFAAFPGH